MIRAEGPFHPSFGSQHSPHTRNAQRQVAVLALREPCSAHRGATEPEFCPLPPLLHATRVRALAFRAERGCVEDQPQQNPTTDGITSYQYAQLRAPTAQPLTSAPSSERQRRGLIPAWGNAPGKMHNKVRGLKARLIHNLALNISRTQETPKQVAVLRQLRGDG